MQVQDVLAIGILVISAIAILIAIVGVVAYIRTPNTQKKGIAQPKQKVVFQLSKGKRVNGKLIVVLPLATTNSIQSAVRYVPADFADWNGIIGWQLCDSPLAVKDVTYVRTYINDLGETQELWITPYDEVSDAPLYEWPPSALAVLLSQGK